MGLMRLNKYRFVGTSQVEKNSVGIYSRDVPVTENNLTNLCVYFNKHTALDPA
jgi:hypothetical protein